MKKLLLVLVLAGAAVAGISVLRSAPAAEAVARDEPSESARWESRAEAADPAAPSAPVEPSAPIAAQAAAAPAADGLSEDEASVLDMYDEISAAFERHAGNCEALANAVRTAATGHASELARVRSAAKDRPAQEASRVEERLQAVAGPRMDKFRANANKQLQVCAKELMPALRLLAGGGDEAAL